MPLFTKRIIRPGTYTVPRADGTSSRVHIGPQRIARWLATFNRMRQTGLAIPAPWRHEEKALPLRLEGDRTDVDAYNNAGFWKRLWVDEHDGSLYGEVDVPRADDADRIGRTVVDVSLLAKPQWIDGQNNLYEDVLTHIALVTHPVAPDSSNFTRSSSSEKDPGVLACGLGDLVMAEDVTPTTPPATSAGPPATPPPDSVAAATATVADALEMLSKMDPPITLPSDTNSQNFLERLVTALHALQSAHAAEGAGADNNTSIAEPPQGAHEKPGPIAMAQDSVLAAAAAAAAKTAPQTPPIPQPAAPAAPPAPGTPPAAGTLSLSQEDQAAINWARNTTRLSYQTRIENCVKSGKITPKLAQEQGQRLLAGLSIAFSADGQLVKGPLDLVLEAWEAIPDGSVLTGRSPTSTAKATKGSLLSGEAFSLAAGLQEIPGPDFDAPTVLGQQPEETVSADEADAIVEEQLKQAGYSSAKVDGGFTATAAAAGK